MTIDDKKKLMAALDYSTLVLKAFSEAGIKIDRQGDPRMSVNTNIRGEYIITQQQLWKLLEAYESWRQIDIILRDWPELTEEMRGEGAQYVS